MKIEDPFDQLRTICELIDEIVSGQFIKWDNFPDDFEDPDEIYKLAERLKEYSCESILLLITNEIKSKWAKIPSVFIEKIKGGIYKNKKGQYSIVARIEFSHEINNEVKSPNYSMIIEINGANEIELDWVKIEKRDE